MRSENDDRIVDFVNRWPFTFAEAVMQAQGGRRFSLATIYDGRTAIAGASLGYPSTWAGLRMALDGLLADAMAGIRLSGSEVCGNSDVIDDEELCIRW